MIHRQQSKIVKARSTSAGLIAINFLEFSVKGSRRSIPKVNSSRIANIAGENEPDTLHLKRTVEASGLCNDKCTTSLTK